MLTEKELEMLNEQFSAKTPKEVLTYCLEKYGNKIALASSLGLEDQVLTDMICKIDKTTRIFTLDTGRLFPETYQLISHTNDYYKINMEVFFPDHTDVEDLVKECGIDCYYKSIEERKRCCYVRKIKPLQRAFQGLDVWICGLRRTQSTTRTNVQLVENDRVNGLVKLNPLIAWSEEDVKKYIQANHVPYNKLHDQGFPSIGCQPCTRAVKPGEDIRAGRWWWEDPDHKECGLHQR
ncbi:MAG: phosphoadenylyl-sulfate reductase [Bacteroidales bacterium]|nr:phosphoadenylyl-sulfate reductase [Bacteroidales bacterium]MBR4453610.1 phosphoadenylyl-sulfate reductase [Bacteroidales bacterium]